MGSKNCEEVSVFGNCGCNVCGGYGHYIFDYSPGFYRIVLCELCYENERLDSRFKMLKKYQAGAVSSELEAG